MLRTFSIQTLGCRVNQYESDQLATLLRARGLEEVESGGDLRIVNTCSVTVQAASKSRQTVRRAIKLPVLSQAHGSSVGLPSAKTLVVGCWATSNPDEASKLPGVDAVLGHHDDVAQQLDRLLALWKNSAPFEGSDQFKNVHTGNRPPAESLGDEGSIISSIQAGTPRPPLAPNSRPQLGQTVKKKVREFAGGTRSLPLLHDRQSSHQRAFLKVQDGCDAHCTYCIIPQLRPVPWSKPIDETVEEARRLVDAGHRELVLTGIFLGAYGQPTALRRRQVIGTAKPLAELVTALCTEVPDLRRLRFSSLEPGDLTNELIDVLRSHKQVVPHFHLPLQSGSDAILHGMNRQYTRDDFLRMIDRVHRAFDRPAITTDMIVGFPGETDDEFAHTLDIVERVRFIHIHAFSFSPRPGTAAARWSSDFVHGPVVNRRIEMLNERAKVHSFEFRKQFLRERAQVLVERNPTAGQRPASPENTDYHHGRSERYFDVCFTANKTATGDLVSLVIDRISPSETWGKIDADSPSS